MILKIIIAVTIAVLFTVMVLYIASKIDNIRMKKNKHYEKN